MSTSKITTAPQPLEEVAKINEVIDEVGTVAGAVGELSSSVTSLSTGKLNVTGDNGSGDVLHALGGSKIEVVNSAVLQEDNILYLVPES